MQSTQDHNSSFAVLMKDTTQVESHFLNCYMTFQQTLVNLMMCFVMVVDILIYGFTEREPGGPPADKTIPNNQESLENKEPTEFVLKDKGLLIFLKAVSTLAVIVIAFSLAMFALAYYFMGYPATSMLQDLILAGLVAFMLFSILTVGVVHSIEGTAKAIDLATAMVMTEMTYTLFALCLAVMFITKARWFTVVPLFLVVWSSVAYYLVLRYGRPRGTYEILKKMSH